MAPKTYRNCWPHSYSPSTIMWMSCVSGREVSDGSRFSMFGWAIGMMGNMMNKWCRTIHLLLFREHQLQYSGQVDRSGSDRAGDSVHHGHRPLLRRRRGRSALQRAGHEGLLTAAKHTNSQFQISDDDFRWVTMLIECLTLCLLSLLSLFFSLSSSMCLSPFLVLC